MQMHARASSVTFTWRYASLADMAEALRMHDVSPVDLAEQALSALGSIGPRYNAVASLVPERALREAKAAERRLAAAGGTSDLRGIPYGVKDLFAARGAPTSWGVPRYRDRVIPRDATAVARLSRKGAVLVAKLAMTELAGGGSPAIPGASVHGSGRHPWDPTRYSGGSSSGSAISVALGLLPYALGSETGGSVLSPSAYCGITGVRPTYGLVPRTGVMPLSWTLDKVGILARSAHDASAVLAAIAGRDRGDASSTGRFVTREVPPSRLRDVRVAYCDDRELCSDAARERIAAGAAEMRRVVPRAAAVEPRRDLPITAIFDTIMNAEAATAFAAELEDPSFELVDARQLATLRAALDMRARDYLHAQRLRTVLIEDFRRVFRECDVIMAATRTSTAQRLDRPREPRTDESWAARLLAGGNLAGLPGVAVPCGLAADGLPVGLQLIGPPGSEALLLSIATAFQRETPHHTLRPPEPE